MRPSKKNLSLRWGLWSSNLAKILEVEFPTKKFDTFGETKKYLSPRLDEVWWSSNFVKDLEVEFLSKKSDTFGETIQKISKSKAG